MPGSATSSKTLQARRSVVVILGCINNSLFNFSWYSVDSNSMLILAHLNTNTFPCFSVMDRYCTENNLKVY